MKKRKPQNIDIMLTYTIYPYDKWMLMSDLLEEIAKLELRQLFLKSEINRQLEQEPERLPPIGKSLEIDMNAIRILDVTNMIERLNRRRKNN